MRPKCGQGSRAATSALSPLDRQGVLDNPGHLSVPKPGLDPLDATIGTVLVAINWCSPVRMSMPAQGGRGADRLLYLAAVRRRRTRAGTSLGLHKSCARPPYAMHLLVPGPRCMNIDSEGYDDVPGSPSGRRAPCCRLYRWLSHRPDRSPALGGRAGRLYLRAPRVHARSEWVHRPDQARGQMG